MDNYRETFEDKLSILLAKYDTGKGNGSDPSDPDMSEIGIIRRENQKLNELIDSQKEIIEVFRTKYLDIAMEYNKKIEQMRQDHLNELNNIHAQFRERLRKEKLSSTTR